MAQGSLIPKGTGFPDYHHRPFGTMSVSVRSGSVEISGTIEHIRRIGTVGYLGTQRYLGRVGTAGRIGSLAHLEAGTIGHVTLIGSLARAGRLGTVGNLGTVRYVQAGSLGRVGRIGTVGHVPSLGSLARVDTLGTVRARLSGSKTLLGTGAVHAAVGSRYIGSWENISRFHTKSYQVLSTLAGSLFVIAGAVGTGPGGLTGTAYRVNLGAGSFHSASFSEQFQFARAIVLAGSVAPGKGTIRLKRNFQV